MIQETQTDTVLNSVTSHWESLVPSVDRISIPLLAQDPPDDSSHDGDGDWTKGGKSERKAGLNGFHTQALLACCHSVGFSKKSKYHVDPR